MVDSQFYIELRLIVSWSDLSFEENTIKKQENQLYDVTQISVEQLI